MFGPYSRGGGVDARWLSALSMVFDKLGYISNAILSKDFILDTKVQPNKMHNAFNNPSDDDLWSRSRSNFLKKGKKLNNLLYLLFPPQTSYLIPRYNPVRRI